MAKYPNQITLTIDKTQSTSLFASYGLVEIATASKCLNGSAFKVYCYLMSNRPNIEWDVSPAHAYNMWGIPISTFHDGFNELIEKGFIIMDKNDKTYGTVYSVPHIDKEEEPYENRTYTPTGFVF